MKRGIAIFWLVSFLSVPIVNLISIADYAFRFSYYAEVLCENKDKPALHCNGKCRLAQNLKTQNKPVEPTLPTIIELRIIAVEQDAGFQLEGDPEKVVITLYQHYRTEQSSDVFLKVLTPPPEFC